MLEVGGADHASGAGGFSGGCGESKTATAINGKSVQLQTTHGTGASYLENGVHGTGYDFDGYLDLKDALIGGQGAHSPYHSSHAGDRWNCRKRWNYKC